MDSLRHLFTPAPAATTTTTAAAAAAVNECSWSSSSNSAKIKKDVIKSFLNDSNTARNHDFRSKKCLVSVDSSTTPPPNGSSTSVTSPLSPVDQKSGDKIEKSANSIRGLLSNGGGKPN